MAKRMRDTRIWNKKWFQELSLEMKLFVGYLDDHCDYVGVWDVNFREVEFRIGKDIQKHLPELPEGFYIEFDEGEKWFMPKFIERQNGDIFEPLEEGKNESSIRRNIKKKLSGYRYNNSTLLNFYSTLKENNSTLDLPLPEGTSNRYSNSKGNSNGKGVLGEKPIPSEESKLEFQAALEMADPLIEFFNVHRVHGRAEMNKCASFILFLIDKGQLDEFWKQFEAYKAYKSKSDEKIHGLDGYLGDPPEYNGGWCKSDWTKKNGQVNGKKVVDPTRRKLRA